MIQISGENAKLFWSMRSGRVTKIHPSFPPLSKDKGLKDIRHSMSTGNLILGVNIFTVSYLISYDSLLQNATDIITKCDNCFSTKCDRNLLQNETGLLLQNATVITNCDDFIAKCDSCYKMRRLLQIATVQSSRNMGI